MFTLSCLALFGCVLMGVWIRCNATDLMSEFYGVLAFCAVTAIGQCVRGAGHLVWGLGGGWGRH